MHNERYAEMFDSAYMGQPPGSMARALRVENARLGLKTCHNCTKAFEQPPVPSGRNSRRIHWSFYFCSIDCARAGGYVRERRGKFVTVTEDGNVILDFSHCKGCAG